MQSKLPLLHSCPGGIRKSAFHGPWRNQSAAGAWAGQGDSQSGFAFERRLLYEKMMDDHELLEKYAREGSQDAFAELLGRHLKLVYSAALRQVRDVQKAQDVTQLVFANLARRAGHIPRQMVLAGWLHRDTRFTALDLLRSESRRAAREQEAMNTLSPETSPDWAQLRPLLDEALDELDPAERDALLLRFFEQRSLKEIGAVLGSGEEAARKRVSRGLDKLRDLLARRGLTTTATALSTVMTAHAVESVPATLGSTILPAAMAANASAIGTASAHIINTMLLTKLKAIGITVALAAGLTTVIVQSRANHRLQEENRALAAKSSSSASANDDVVPSSLSAGLSADQFSELLRLRGEVTRLRENASNAAASNLAVATNSMPAPVINTPAKALNASLTARVPNDDTLITGGWSNGPGTRLLLLVTPTLVDGRGWKVNPANIQAQMDNSLEVTIRTKLVQVADAALAQTGLDNLVSDTPDSSQSKVFTEEDAGNLISKLQQNNGVEILSSPNVTTMDGRESTLEVVAPGDTGTRVTSLDVLPNLAADRKTWILSVYARVSATTNSSN